MVEPVSRSRNNDGFLMLKTRIITAIALLGGVFAILYSGNALVFELFLTAFFALALWECFRLFGASYPVFWALLLMPILPMIMRLSNHEKLPAFLGMCVVVWVLRFIPTLKLGLPPLKSFKNIMLTGMYAAMILACFIAIYLLQQRSSIFLLSVFVIVILADVGGYTFGRLFGKRKLAPSVSPNKTWEGAIGGWLSVLILVGISTQIALFSDTFATQLLLKRGWFVLILVLTSLVILSVLGDLFESSLKRRIDMKDSSQLLPGHGGVLDRLDAMIPVLPLAGLFLAWL